MAHHGMMENPSFIDGVSSYKPTFIGDLSLPCLITRGYNNYFSGKTISYPWPSVTHNDHREKHHWPHLQCQGSRQCKCRHESQSATFGRCEDVLTPHKRIVLPTWHLGQIWVLPTLIPVRSQWGRHNSPIYIYVYTHTCAHQHALIICSAMLNPAWPPRIFMVGAGAPVSGLETPPAAITLER